MTDDPLPRRQARLAEVAATRLSWVRCAAEHTWHRHNVSALLRSADAFGVHHVHLIGERPFEAARAHARGADHWLAVHAHPTTADAVAAIHNAGCALWVADLDAGAVPPEMIPLERPVCVWLGAELAGVSEEARAAADGVVRLPMYGLSQSLNLAAAGTAILYTLGSRARAQHEARALLSPNEQQALLGAWLARDAGLLSGG